MILSDVLLIAAHTNRSKAYIQALNHVGIKLGSVLLYGQSQSGMLGQGDDNSGPPVEDVLFSPDFSIDLEKSARDLGSCLVSTVASNINDQEIFDATNALKPSLIIFSGYGSQILQEKILGIPSQFLHIHAGYLPVYRGSTTIYYSWIEKMECGASAILLSKEIDKGPIVARKIYSPPAKGVDPDYLYDSAIRADLLVEVLGSYLGNGEFENKHEQDTHDQDIYYIIHPLLKHLVRIYG